MREDLTGTIRGRPAGAHEVEPSQALRGIHKKDREEQKEPAHVTLERERGRKIRKEVREEVRQRRVQGDGERRAGADRGRGRR